MNIKFPLVFFVFVVLTACGGNGMLPAASASAQADVLAQNIFAGTNVQLENNAQDVCAPCAFDAMRGSSKIYDASDKTVAIRQADNRGASDYKSVHNPNHSIVTVVMTTGVQGDDNVPVDNVSAFDPNIETLYAVVSTQDTAPGTVIRVRWIAANVPGVARDSLIDSSQISVKGNVNIAFSLRRNDARWASGAYRLDVFEDGEPDGTLDFTIDASPAPPGNGSGIARVITFQETDRADNPIDLHGEFPQGAKTLGAAVFINGAKTIEVKGVWYTVQVPGWPDDTELFQDVQSGNQSNPIFFTLVRRSGEAWLAGKYKLELYVNDKLANTVAFHVAGAAAQPTPSQPKASALEFTYKGQLNVTPGWHAPAALTVAPNGDLYVAESGSVRRVKQDLSNTSFGEMGMTQGDAKLSPVVSGIAADSNSNLWVANPQHSNIQKFSAGGKFLLRVPGDDSRTYDKDGEVNQAYGIAIDRQNNVYVSDTLNNRIQKFNTDGKFIAKWTNPGLKTPIGIAVDAQGNLYVADAGNQRIVKIDPQGKLLLQFGKQGTGDGEFNNPWNIALDAAGNIYVTDIQNQRVQVFDARGKFITKFGKRGTGDGQFEKPAGILVGDGGNVFVTDGSNNTVQVFAPVSAPNNPSGSGAKLGEGRIVADLGFRPAQDGFGFENYIGEYPQEQGDLFVEDLIRLFGEQSVCAGFKNGECQVAPGALEWADRANRASNGGHCEGLAVLSLRMFVGKDAKQQFGAARTVDLKYENQDLQRAIMYYFSMQTADPVWSKKEQGVSKTPSQVLDDIIAGIEQHDPTVVAVRHYYPNGERSGHAVAPYAVEDRGNGIFYVWIYDNNAPRAERYLVVDRNANTWKYDMGSINPTDPAEPWSGGAADHTFGAARISVRDGQAQCEWCGNGSDNSADSLTTVTLFGGGKLFATNDKGQRIGWVNGKFVNEIPGARDDAIDGGLGEPSVPVFYLPSDATYEMALDGSDLTQLAESELFVFGGGKSLNIDRITLAPGEINSLTLGGNLDTFRYEPESSEDSQVTFTVNGAQDDYFFAFDGIQIDKAETLTFTLDETLGTLAIDSANSSGADTYNLTLKRVGDNGMQIFENETIAFGGGETHYIDYGGWDGAEALSIGVDANGDGKVDQQLNEDNQR